MFKTNDGLPAITQLAHVTIKSRDHTHLFESTDISKDLVVKSPFRLSESFRLHTLNIRQG